MSFELNELFDKLKGKENSLNLINTGAECQEKCNSCDSLNIVTQRGEIICKDCGIINYNLIDHNAEWRYYGSEDSKYSDPTRCGLPTNELLPESSLGSTISFKHGESYEMKKIRNYL